MKPIKFLIRDVKPISFLIGVIKPVRFALEKFVEFFYEMVFHVDYTILVFAETAYLLAKAMHTDFTITALSAASRFFLKVEHSDLSRDASLLFLRMQAYCESVSRDICANELAVRMYGKVHHVDVATSELSMMVIRPIRVYENNNRLTNDLELTVKEMTILELT